MTAWWAVYLVSVIDGVQSAAVAVVFIAVFGVFMSLSASMFVEDNERERRDAVLAQVAQWRKRLVIAGCTCGALVALVPTKDDVIKAYVMVEGSKLVTADSAQAAAREIAKRVDALIGAIGR